MTSRLIEALRKVETPGAFSVRVTAPPDDLSLEVKDVGPVRLPVSARNARKLIGVPRPAPTAVLPKRTSERVTPTLRGCR